MTELSLQYALKWSGEILPRLFPQVCGVGCRAISHQTESLSGEEAKSVSKFSDSRRMEFCAGRSAAREALRHIGILSASIPINPDRSPRWPAGIVGSIAHSSGIAIAVVARQRLLRSVGVDIESIAEVKATLYPEFLTESEIRCLESFSCGDRARFGAVIFSLKEAFFKYQFPHTSQWIEFRDTQVEIDVAQNCGILTTKNPLKMGDKSCSVYHGSFRIGANLVLSGFFS